MYIHCDIKKALKKNINNEAPCMEQPQRAEAGVFSLTLGRCTAQMLHQKGWIIYVV